MDLSFFLNQNATKPENIKFAVSKRFVDKKGKPVEWELQVISADEDSALRKQCEKKIPTGKRGQFTVEMDSELYMAKLAAACTVYPNLLSAELQDSYKVKTPEQLIKAMLTSGEYIKFIDKIQVINGFDELFEDKVDVAKN